MVINNSDQINLFDKTQARLILIGWNRSSERTEDLRRVLGKCFLNKIIVFALINQRPEKRREDYKL